jgi:hypothetical protein
MEYSRNGRLMGSGILRGRQEIRWHCRGQLPRPCHQRQQDARGLGNNSFGELDGPSGERFKEVGAGLHYSVGITRDGRLVAWGDNAHGQHQVPAGKFGSLSAVAFHVAAIRH